MRAGAASPAKNSRGWGSKMRTHEVRFASRALAVTRSMSARWPRCTPSKLPIVSAHRPRARCKEPCVTTMDSVKTLNYSVFAGGHDEDAGRPDVGVCGVPPGRAQQGDALRRRAGDRVRADDRPRLAARRPRRLRAERRAGGDRAAPALLPGARPAARPDDGGGARLHAV